MRNHSIHTRIFRAACALMSVCMLLACVPTPETEFVVNKGEQKEMLDLAKVEIASNVVSDSQGTANRIDYETLFGIPQHLTIDETGPDGTIRLLIDADVILPDGPLPVVRVFADQFDQTTVTKLWDVLVGDKTLYLEDDRPYVETKEDIAERLRFLNEIEDDPARWDERGGMYDSREEIEEDIRDLQERYRTAPEAGPAPSPVVSHGILYRETVTMDGTDKNASRTVLHAGTRTSKDNYRDSMQFHVQNDTDNTEAIVVNYDDGWGVIPIDKDASMFWNRWSPANSCGHTLGNAEINVNRTDPLPEAAKGFLHMTPEEAASRVEVFLETAGLSDTFGVAQIWLCDDRSPANRKPDPSCFSYHILCMRKVNGALCCAARNIWRSGEDLFSRSYVPEWSYERMLLELDDDGLFSVSWHGKLAVSDTLTKASNLLPFQQIQQIIRTRLPISYPHRSGWSSSDKGCTVRIDRIELGLWRVFEQNELGRGLLVPAYCLYGTVETVQSDGSTWEDAYSLCYILNAVDGSVIDPDKGY